MHLLLPSPPSAADKPDQTISEELFIKPTEIMADLVDKIVEIYR